jgi:hypothetical protein
MGGENQHLRFLQMLFNPSRYFHSRHTRHVEIDDRNIGPLFKSSLKCSSPVGGLSNDIPTWTLLQHGSYSTSYCIMIVSYEDSLHEALLDHPLSEKTNEPRDRD